jgi:hypothetical protein
MRKNILNFDIYAKGIVSITRSNMQWAPLDLIFVDIVSNIIGYAYVLLEPPESAVQCL